MGHLHRTVRREEFAALVAPLIGLRVNRVWRSVGTTFFLELGDIRREPRLRGPGHHHKGQATAMIDWTWRVERAKSIEFGDYDTNRKIDLGLQRLKRRHVETVEVCCRLPELSIGLTGGRWVQTCMCHTGQPRWCLFLPDESNLHVECGRIVHSRYEE